MKQIFMAIFVLLLLAGGGAGAYFYFEQPAEAAIGETDEHQTAGEAKASHDSHAKDAAHHEFVELDPLVLPIIDSNGVSQVVSLVVVIEVDGSRNQQLVLDLEPKLKDAYIQELYGVLNKHAALKGGILQVGMIKSRLYGISDRVLGEDVVEDVLLKVVQQRPI